MANNNSKVDKAQLFQKPSAVSGIRGTIRRRQEAFAQEQAKERQENIQKAEKYIQRIQKGEVTNINEVPKGPRKYIDLGNFFEENKKKIKSKLEEAEKKEKELNKRYSKKLGNLYDWYNRQEKTESVRRAFREEKRDLKEDIRSEAKYYEELSTELKRKLKDLEKGEILDAESAIDFSERAADIEQRRVEGRVESERLKEFREEYTTKKNGEVSLKEGVKREDLPTQFKQFVDVKSVKRGGTKGFTQKERDKISAWMKKNKMTPTPETIRKDILSKPKVKVQEKISNKDAYEILGIEKPKIESEFVRKVFEERRKDVIESRQNLQQETERNKELGFPQNKAQVLAEESLRKGGVTFTPEGATDVLLEDIAKEQNKKIRQNLRSLGDTWKNIFNKYGASFPSSVSVPATYKRIEGIITGEKDQIYEDVYKDTRELIQGVSGVMQSLRQRGVQKLSEKEINNLEKEISNLEESLKEGEKVYSTSWGMYEKADSKKLEEVRKELEETRKQVTSGIPTKSAQIKGSVIDIGADIFPP